MTYGRIPKDLLYGELEHGLRPARRPKLRYVDVCNRDMNTIGLAVENLEVVAADREGWNSSSKALLEEGEWKIRMEAIEKRERRKVAEVALQSSDFVCPSCGHLCHFRSGLFSHTNFMAFMTEYGLLHAVSLCAQGPTTLRKPQYPRKRHLRLMKRH